MEGRLVLVWWAVVALAIGLCGASDTLATGGSMTNNQQLQSGNGFYVFRMQSDCNLVLYRVSDSHPLWSSGTNGKGSGCSVIMQSDGNLVIYDNQNLAKWSSKTNRKSDSYNLEMQNDGNVVIYTSQHVAIWATGTVQ